MCTINKSVDITDFDDAEVVEVQRPYDSAWGMYYDEFDDAKPDEIETWVKKQEVIYNDMTIDYKKALEWDFDDGFIDYQ